MTAPPLTATTILAAFHQEDGTGASLPLFQSLLDSGAWDPNEGVGHSGTPLQLAAAGDHLLLTKWLLAHGADPNAYTQNLLDTTLATACRASALPVIELLLDGGAEVKNSGALQAAAEAGRVDVLELLVGRGADVDEVPVNAWMERRGALLSPLQAAVRAKQPEAVAFLVGRGAGRGENS
ncbi:ankyrin repeat-containing domain protein [Mycena sp. CBHHK59/15]|nr:ankyrin repeat-containing domain protein [Mycena sp. CBHHK59/15]